MVKALKCSKTKSKEKVSSFTRLCEWNKFYGDSNFGVGIQCTKCDKWRIALEYTDSHEVPEDWECSMTKINNIPIDCSMPSPHKEEDFGKEKYVPGSVVWAKMLGFPWWPGMVEDSPDEEQFYKEVPEKGDFYHVTFFVEKKAQRGWITDSKITPFVKPPSTMSKCSKIMENNLKKAEEIAKTAIDMSSAERLKNFSFGKQFKGRWGTAICSDNIPKPLASTKRKRIAVKSGNQSLTKVKEEVKVVSSDSPTPPQKKRGRKSKNDLEKEKTTHNATPPIDKENPTGDAISSAVKEKSACDDDMTDAKSKPTTSDESFKNQSPKRSPDKPSTGESDSGEDGDESDFESLDEYSELELSIIKEGEEISKINMYNRIRKKLLKAMKNDALSDDEDTDVPESDDERVDILASDSGGEDVYIMESDGDEDDMNILVNDGEEDVNILVNDGKEEDMNILANDGKEVVICSEKEHSVELNELGNGTLIECASRDNASGSKEGNDVKVNGTENYSLGEDDNLQVNEKDPTTNGDEFPYNPISPAAKNGASHGNTFLPPSEISASKERLESFLNQSCNLLCEPIGYEAVPVSEKEAVIPPEEKFIMDISNSGNHPYKCC